METTRTRTADLNDAELADLLAKTDKVNARAARQGWTGRYEVTYTRVRRTWETAGGLTADADLWETTVTGQPACYAGWTFLAALDWDWDLSATGEPTLVTRCAPGFEGTIDRTALKPGGCDHCKTARHRTRTYLVEGEDGTRIQVGSTCLKDFLGHDVRFRWMDDGADLLDDDEGGFGWGGGGMPAYDPLTVLRCAWAVIQMQGGYVPSDGGALCRTPTKHVVEQALRPASRSALQKQYDHERGTAKLAEVKQAHGVKITRRTAEEAPGQAVLIRDYLLDDERWPAGSEYEINLKTVLRAERVTPKHFGLLCSAPAAWARAVGADLRRQAEQDSITNEHIGQAKDKIEVDVRVKSIAYSESYFGYTPKTTTIYTLITADGHVLKWFSSNAALGHEAEKSFRIKATIKGHDEWQGTKQTVITRATVVTAKAA
jgi:hypothetical protein